MCRDCTRLSSSLVLLCMSRVDVVGKRMLLTELFSPSSRIRSFRVTEFSKCFPMSIQSRHFELVPFL